MPPSKDRVHDQQRSSCPLRNAWWCPPNSPADRGSSVASSCKIARRAPSPSVRRVRSNCSPESIA
jgi:hypothetical protein